MANLIPLDTERNDRGQILLLAAFALAVSFVVLALVVNSAIFTENLATREDVAGSHDALDHRYEVETNVERLIQGVNNDSELDEGDLETSIEQMVEEGAGQQASQGRLVSVSYVDSEPGTKIAQDTVRNFTNADDNQGRWNVTDTTVDTDTVRNFKINVTEPFVDSEWGSTPFQLVLNGTDPDEEWVMEIDETSGGDGIEVTVEHPDYPDEEVCTREDIGEYTIVDVTGATVDDEPCHALGQLHDGTDMWFGTGVDSPYRIEFDNSWNIEGTYSFILGTGGVDDNEKIVPVNQQDEGPYYDDDAIYSADLSYEFYTSAVGYETDIRVAPGEIPS